MAYTKRTTSGKDWRVTIRELPSQARKRVLADAVEFIAKDLQIEIGMTAPVRTGKLAGALTRGIAVNSPSRCKGFVGWYTSGKQDPFYIWFVEYGTAHSRANPFVRRAYTNNIDGIMERAQLRLATNIIKELGGTVL